MTASFPGGLRAQLLVGLSAMLLATLALGGIIVENLLTRRLFEERYVQAAMLADALVLAQTTPLPDQTGAGRVACVIRDPGGHQSAGCDGELASRMRALVEARGSTRETMFVDGGSFATVVRRDGTRVAGVAVELDSIRADVAKTRSVLLLFLGVVALFVLALGTAFFTHLVLRPVRAIGVATERAAQGDLASPIALIPGNEYGRVARSFNQMLDRLDSGRAQLQAKVRELERANADLERTRDSLVRSEKLASVGQLAAGVAHEIGNPLAALSGFNEILLDAELDDEERRDLLARSGTQLERIRTVIRSLLDFSREERADEPQPTDLGRAVSEAVALVSVLPAARQVTIEVDDPGGPLVAAVSSQVVQVLVNLTMNALDAMRDSGAGNRIVISRHDRGDGTVVLLVSDDGPGIPSELRARIFDPFFTTKEPGAGTGLGLSISARIMESLGGDLELLETDEGASFALVFHRWEER